LKRVTSCPHPDLNDATETVKLVTEAGGQAIAVRGDTSDEAAVDDLKRRAKEEFGPVNVVVNNVGIFPAHSFLDIPVDEWDRVLRVNLRSNFLISRAFLPAMRDSGWGRIVSIASTTYHVAPHGMAHYITSKGGVIGFTRALAAEVGDWGVTVNAIAAGGKVTPAPAGTPRPSPSTRSCRTSSESQNLTTLPVHSRCSSPRTPRLNRHDVRFPS
jgi:NAD(P)-dependent dehydrogenase (short-subunit alcohol dehydrogenase family)